MLRQIHRLTLCAAVCATLLSAQAPTPRPPQPPRIKSPEIHADRTVTFRLRAPNAKEVLLSGELAAKPLPFAAGENGIWTVTTPVLDADIYSYSFRVDGVNITDPNNPAVKDGINGITNELHIPGTPPNIWDEQQVPHGLITRHHYHSAVVGDDRAFVVYTPPGYDPAGRTQYPVLYLVHGSGDLSTSWIDHGRANFILDNLLAQGKIKPMVLVTPFGHAVAPGADRGKNLTNFEADLLQSIKPVVEKAYRVKTDADNRAIAGLSMGGGHTIWTGFHHPELFHWIAAFSSSVPPKEQIPMAGMNKMKLLWVGIGKDDFLIKANNEFDQLLTEQKITHTYRVTEGTHNWKVWRRYLAEVAPLLFR